MTDKNELYDLMNNHLLVDDYPSKYFNEIASEPFFMEYPFNLILKLKDIKQSPKYHPEGNVWNHTMLVVDEAAKVKQKSKDQKAFMWAALLHDIGKPDTTRVRKGKITSYNHEKVGADLAKDFLHEFTNQEDFIEKVEALVHWHMQILFVVNDLSFADVKSMKEQVDVKEVGLLGWCDRMGRGLADKEVEEENIRKFMLKVNK